jgi:hypothetical protein
MSDSKSVQTETCIDSLSRIFEAVSYMQLLECWIAPERHAVRRGGFMRHPALCHQPVPFD